MESTSLQQLLIVIILLILGWNSLQFQKYLCSNAQPVRNFYNAGSEPVIYSIQIDFLHQFFKQLPLVPQITHWYSQYHRPKPPWFNLVQLRKITTGFVGINIQIFTTRNKFFPLYPFALNDLSTFTTCSMLSILMFHTELTVCSIGTNLEPLIIENIDFLQYNHKHSYHFNKICKNRDILSSSTHLDRSVHKPPWISSKIGLKDGDFLSQEDICHGLHMIRSAITYCTRAPSARQLQILLLLHLFQAVQARDANTCYRMIAILIVFIPATLVVVPLLLSWAAYNAYRVLSNTLVNIAIYVILLPCWVSGLLAPGVEGLDLEQNLWPMYINLASMLRTQSPSTTISRDVLERDIVQDLPTDHEFKAKGIKFSSPVSLIEQPLSSASLLWTMYGTDSPPTIDIPHLSLEETLSHIRIVYQRLQQISRRLKRTQKHLNSWFIQKCPKIPSIKADNIARLLLLQHRLRKAHMQFSNLLQKLQQTSKARKKAVQSTSSNQMLRMQATSSSSVQPFMDKPQSKLGHDQNTAVNTELQQLAQEFRTYRRAHCTAPGNIEGQVGLLSDSGGSVNVELTQRQHAKALEALTHPDDMLSVLTALHDKCTYNGLSTWDYISQEDALLLDQIYHE